MDHKKILFLSAVTFSNFLFAAEESNLDKWFDKMNIIKSTNSAEIIADQSLGVHFLGGTGTVRTRVIDLNPVHIQMPQFSAGCGGISYSMGAINLISGKDLINSGKAILSNAKTYAFELALQTATPIVSSTMGQLQDYANQFNSNNINSCEIARSLINAAAPATDNISGAICEYGGSNVLMDDLIQRRHKCNQNDGNIKSNLVRKAEQESDVLVQNYNLAWKVFNKMDNLSLEDKNLLLNLTGTIISRRDNEDSPPSISIYPSKGKEVWQTILNGGTIEGAYAFIIKKEKDSQGNLSSIDDLVQAGIEKREWMIGLRQAWQPRFLRAMQSLQKKIQGGPLEGSEKGELSLEETKLLDGCKVPIGTLLVINSRKGSDANLGSLQDYASVEASIRLYHFFLEALTKIKEVALSLNKAQIGESKVKEVESWIRELDKLSLELAGERNQIQNRLTSIMQFEKFLREKDDFQRSLESDL